VGTLAQAIEINRQMLTAQQASEGGNAGTATASPAVQLQLMLDESMIKFVAAVSKLGIDVKM
jgi:hypothetical protein